MTPTETLRAMLDERGVKHTDAEDGHTQHTWWSDGDHEIAACNSGERLAVYNLTPEQAVDATLGSCNCSNNCTNSERTNDELLPCPFCGSNAETVHTLNVVPHEPWWIRCPSCGVTTPKHSSETDAIAAWNRRAES